MQPRMTNKTNVASSSSSFSPIGNLMRFWRCLFIMFEQLLTVNCTWSDINDYKVVVTFITSISMIIHTYIHIDKKKSHDWIDKIEGGRLFRCNHKILDYNHFFYFSPIFIQPQKLLNLMNFWSFCLDWNLYLLNAKISRMHRQSFEDHIFYEVQIAKINDRIACAGDLSMVAATLPSSYIHIFFFFFHTLLLLHFVPCSVFEMKAIIDLHHLSLSEFDQKRLV